MEAIEVICITDDETDEDTETQTDAFFSGEKEWPAYKGRRGYETPLLIMELYRLIPFLNQMGKTKFHPLNMKEMEVGKVLIVGLVHKVNSNNKFTIEAKISDGTGSIPVVCRKSSLKYHQDSRRIISLKHRTIANNAFLKKSWLDNPNEWKNKRYQFHDERPPIWYNQEMPPLYIAKLQHDWWVETNGGMIGKEIKVNDYVEVKGYCTFDFEKGQKPRGKITEKDLQVGKLYIFALDLKCISEHQYNRVIQQVIFPGMGQRYNKI